VPTSATKPINPGRTGSRTLDAAIWGCELAKSDGPERIYIVELAGVFEDDPTLTDKRFPGNPTRSYRSRAPLRIVGEVTEWEPHPPDRLKEMKDASRGWKPKAI
jgi:rifampin ADP-ribosylating transferase